MTLTVKLLLVAALVLGIIVPFGYFLKGESRNVTNVHLEQMLSFILERLPSQRSCYFPEIRYTLQRQQQPLQMQPDLVISQPHCQPVFPVSVVVLP